MDRKSALDTMGAWVAAIVMSVYALTMLAPYGLAMLGIHVDPALQQTVKDNKNTVDLITTAVVMFFFGASVGKRHLEEANATQASTIQAAQAALTPTEPTIPVEPGQRVTVEGKPE